MASETPLSLNFPYLITPQFSLLKILILTSCTGKKSVSHVKQLTSKDFKAGPDHLTRRENELSDFCRTAGDIYAGEQHLRLMRGVRSMREVTGKELRIEVAVDVLSAGYGLIPECRMVAPYELTFSTMKSKELRDWSDTLSVPEDFRKIVTLKYDLCLILMGDNYLAACALEENVSFGGPTILFCGTRTAKKLKAMQNVRVVPISNSDAKRFSCGLVGLKGELAARLMTHVKSNPISIKHLMRSEFNLLDCLFSVGPALAKKVLR